MKALIAAMIVVESGGDCNAVGDGGLSIGPLQIGWLYYQDAAQQLHDEEAIDAPALNRETYERWAKDPELAARLVKAYWRRYAPNEYRGANYETLARIHNGGPMGHYKRATLAYWAKVKAEMEAQKAREGAQVPR